MDHPLLGSVIAGLAAFVVLVGWELSPLLAWVVGWTVPAFAMCASTSARRSRSLCLRLVSVG